MFIALHFNAWSFSFDNHSWKLGYMLGCLGWIDLAASTKIEKPILMVICLILYIYIIDCFAPMSAYGY